jgi:hypothetical protein
MSPPLERLLALTVSIVVAVTPLACSRTGSDRGTSAGLPPAGGYENPADVSLPCPAQPSGAQTVGRDSLLNRFRPNLEPWAAMWAQAQPGFGLDSTWLVERTPWRPLETRVFRPPSKGTEEETTFDVLGLRSPDDHYTLDVDAYQSIEPQGDTLEVGGEPDSQCTLIDHHTGRETVIGFSGAPGGYHWGAWLTPGVFAVGAWRDADEFGHWKQARLSIYSISDSTVSEYQTRIVSEATFELYVRAWHRWLLERYQLLSGKHAT